MSSRTRATLMTQFVLRQCNPSKASSYANLLLFVFCHHFRGLLKNEVSMRFGLWHTYLRANLLALSTDSFVRHLHLGSRTCPHVLSILTSHCCSHWSVIMLLLPEKPRIEIYPAIVQVSNLYPAIVLVI